MKRMRLRNNLLLMLKIAIGIVLMSFFMLMIEGRNWMGGAGFGAGILIFQIFGGWLGAELNAAIEVANLRIDKEVIRNDCQDRAIESMGASIDVLGTRKDLP